MRGLSRIWLGLLFLGACTAKPMANRPADASVESAVEVATDLPAVATDLPVSVADVAKQTCGNSQLDPGEACDDGNTVSGDGCSSKCTIEDDWPPCGPGPGLAGCGLMSRCGNGVLTSNETCDDGNNVSGDGCSGDCQIVEPGWHCRIPGARCTPICGDGILKGGETCDDGNTVNGDGCSFYCLTEPGCSEVDGGIDSGCQQPYCGDGILSGAEECDRGTLNADDEYGGCTTQCFAGPFCGDGMVNGSEACDLGAQNGKTDGPGGCTLGCTKTHYCGDGIVDTQRGEECDLGDRNGLRLDRDENPSDALDALVYCTADCKISMDILHS